MRTSDAFLCIAALVVLATACAADPVAVATPLPPALPVVAATALPSGSATPPVAAIANAGAVVGGLRAGFRSGYNAGLNVDPTMAGSVRLGVKVAPDGQVFSVDPVDPVGLSDEVVQCLVRRAKAAQFDAPGPAGATLQIPIKFVQQPRAPPPLSHP